VPGETEIVLETHERCLRELQSFCGSIRMPDNNRLRLNWLHSYSPTAVTAEGEYEHKGNVYAAEACDWKQHYPTAQDDVGRAAIYWDTYSAEPAIFWVRGFDAVCFGPEHHIRLDDQTLLFARLEGIRVSESKLPRFLVQASLFRIQVIENLLAGRAAFTQAELTRMLELEKTYRCP